MKKISAALIILLVFLCGFTASASEQRVFDYADLFTPEQEIKLEKEISLFQKDTAMDFIVLTTVEKIDEQVEYADSFYDTNDFGYGKNNSGVLYFIDMHNRTPYLCTTGDAIDIMTDLRIQYAHEICYSALREGNYSEAVQKMIVTVKAYSFDGVPFGQFRYQKGNE